MSERQIHITREGVQFGPYPEASAKEMLTEGQLLPTDLAWHQGSDGWKPLQELLGAKTAETPPPIPQDIKPEEQSDDGEQSGKIRVMRNGEAIGPYSWDKAREYFITGQLLPTDVGCADETGDDWKPLNEVLGLPLPTPMSTTSGAKSGKGKKIAIIVGIVVLLSGLIFAGITYGPDLVAKVTAAKFKPGTYESWLDGGVAEIGDRLIFKEDGTLEQHGCILDKGKQRSESEWHKEYTDYTLWKLVGDEIHVKPNKDLGESYKDKLIYKIQKDGNIQISSIIYKRINN